MRIIVTNDDGVHAQGILVLARHLCEAGHDVMVVAPLVEASGSSAATGVWRGATARHVPYEKVPLDLPGSVTCYGLEALPALCVSVAIAGAFGPAPECVVSGINRGRNVGTSVLHSGTVGAALTAARRGIPAIAMSIEAHRDEPHYETPASLIGPLLRLACDLPAGLCVNFNVADLLPEEVRGVAVAQLGGNPMIFDATAKDGLIDLVRGLGHARNLAENTDELLTTSGYATVTVLQPPVEIDDVTTGPLMRASVDELNKIVHDADRKN